MVNAHKNENDTDPNSGMTPDNDTTQTVEVVGHSLITQKQYKRNYLLRLISTFVNYVSIMYNLVRMIGSTIIDNLIDLTDTCIQLWVELNKL